MAEIFDKTGPIDDRFVTASKKDDTFMSEVPIELEIEILYKNGEWSYIMVPKTVHSDTPQLVFTIPSNGSIMSNSTQRIVGEDVYIKAHELADELAEQIRIRMQNQVGNVNDTMVITSGTNDNMHKTGIRVSEIVEFTVRVISICDIVQDQEPGYYDDNEY